MLPEQLEEYQAQAELNRQQMEQQNAPYAAQVHEQVQQAQAVLVEQTNPSKVVETIMLRLQGKMRMADGSEVIVGSPKMNKKGIEKIWFLLDSHINQNIILSHLDRDDIGKIMNALQEDLVDNLSLNWKFYGIEHKTDLDDINDSILVNIYACLKRAEGQNEKNWLGKISVEQISSAPRMPQSKKGGFWNNFKL